MSRMDTHSSNNTELDIILVGQLYGVSIYPATQRSTTPAQRIHTGGAVGRGGGFRRANQKACIPDCSNEMLNKSRG